MNTACKTFEPSCLSFDENCMKLAFEEAERALKEGEVPVGCVFVLNENGVRTPVAVGCNSVNKTKNATRHAEMNCVDDVETLLVSKKIDRTSTYRNIEVYVNVEPCIMCASALLQLQVGAIFFGCCNERFGGCGSVLDVFKTFTSAGDYRPLVEGGHDAVKSVDLLKTFYKGENPNAPEEKRKPARD